MAHHGNFKLVVLWESELRKAGKLIDKAARMIEDPDADPAEVQVAMRDALHASEIAIRACCDDKSAIMVSRYPVAEDVGS